MRETETAWFTAGHRPKRAARQERVGVDIWRLIDSEGRSICCTLHDDSAIGAGWDVCVVAQGEPLYSQRCADRVRADAVARALRQDALRGGCREPADE